MAKNFPPRGARTEHLKGSSTPHAPKALNSVGKLQSYAVPCEQLTSEEQCRKNNVQGDANTKCMWGGDNCLPGSRHRQGMIRESTIIPIDWG